MSVVNDELTKSMIAAACELTKSMVPVRIEALWGTVVGAFGTMVTYLYGGWNSAMDTLLALVVMDYISGMLAAYINPRLALNSQKGFMGIARKIFIFLIVAMAHRIDVTLGVTGICTVATWFYIGNEGLSITENAAKAGVPIPNTVKSSLEQLSREKKVREDKGVK